MIVKFLSWNVNGLRALLQKPQWEWLEKTDADIVGLQETKAAPEQLPEAIANLPGWDCYWDWSTVKKGYSGVGVFSRIAPLKVTAQLPQEEYRGEGRLLHLEYPEFHFFNGYFPNGGMPETDADGKPLGTYKRVPYKLGFFEAFLEVAFKCEQEKPVVVCGDFNIAHREIDLSHPKENEGTSGFLPEERAIVDRLLSAGFVDTFRLLHPDERERYTWWSYQRNARKRNLGWRIDYFFVSKGLVPNIRDAEILGEIQGSDHCPTSLTLEI